MEKRIKGGLKPFLSSVPRRRGKLKYVPMSSLPVGTEFFFTTEEYDPPKHLGIPEIADLIQRDSVLIVPAGRHKLQKWSEGRVEITFGDEKSQVVKPLFACLAPTGVFEGNFDEDFVTWQLRTGEITEVRIDNYCLKSSDFPDARRDETTRPRPLQRPSRFGRKVYDRGIEYKMSQLARQGVK